jgi:bis(5'-adenosyl)-triphosphatase
MVTLLFFSTFEVTRQAFHRTMLAYAIVNLNPIVPGRMCNVLALY